MSVKPVTITITGAGGQIGYALLFRIASGAMLGPDTPVRLHLLEIPEGVRAAEGAALELHDSAFPLLAHVDVFDDADVVVGNPANTNALIAAAHAPEVPADRFTALTRLDHNRALAQLAPTVGTPVGEIRDVTIWGNHSATQFPDISHATAGGQSIPALLQARLGGPEGLREWLVDDFIPRVAKRGAEIIEVRGSSSVASAASATIDHLRDWVHGTSGGWTSAAVVSDGSYDVPEGLVSSFPVESVDGAWRIVQGLELDAFARHRIAASVAELEEERDAVRSLGLI